MPFAKEGCRPPRKMGAGVVEAMASRQHKNNLSELGVNWLGNGHLNASESDLKYKYHVAHLSDVYWGRSKVNNNTPRSVANPPPWANLDPRVLSPIPDKKKREDRWDDHFFRGNCLQQNEVCGGSSGATLRKRPASAGARRGRQELSSAINASNCGSSSAKKPQERLKIRPSSANERSRGEAYGRGTKGGVGGGDSSNTAVRNRKKQPLKFAENRQGAPVDDIADYCAGDIGGVEGYLPRDNITNMDVCVGNNTQGDINGAYSVEEREIMAGGYRLNDGQKSTFRNFVAMLVDFDACSTVCILDDVFREAQIATGLQDYTGCGAD